jgi:hypothetical protein
LPEALFDLDYPGHYLRRIKNVSLTIPCVTGPYTSINCTLTLLSSKIRLDSNAQGDYTDQSDPRRFLASYRPAQSIVTSQAQNDSGLFELNFKDERYLPFEGAGVISEWRIELPVETNAFDLDSITDVVMKLSYTSREGGELLRKVALEAATLPAPSRQDVSNPGPDLPNQPELLRLVSARHEFPNEWQRFLQGTGPEAFQALAFELTPERFPYQYRGKKFSISRVDLFLQVNNQQVYSETTPLKVQLLPPDQPDGESMELRSNSGDNNGLPHAIFDFSSQPGKLGQWTLQIKEEDISNLDSSWWNELNLNGTPHFRLKPARLEDLMLVLHYSVKKP